MTSLAQLGDEAALGRLVSTFCRAADHEATVDAVVALFTDDGVFELPDHNYVGHSAIAEFLQSGRDSGITGPASGSRHLACNLIVSTGDASSDEATGWMEWLLVAPSSESNGGERIMASGRYEDRYERTPGGWLISHRRVAT